MLEENFLNIKSGSRVSEDTMSFVVEDLKFHLTMKIKLDNIEISIRELASGANYISKKILSEFIKNEIFKGSQNSQTIKEIIFKIIINNLAKISFNNNKCFLNLGIKNPATSNILIGISSSGNSNKELNCQIELIEDSDVNSLVQNFLRITEELEKENKNMKVDLDKFRVDFASFKEEKNKEIKELKQNETERKNEIQSLKAQMEIMSILFSNAINNNSNSNNNNIVGTVTANNLVASGSSYKNFNNNNNNNEVNLSQNKNQRENKFLNNFASTNSKSSQNVAFNNLISTSPAKASIYPSNQSPNLDANIEKFKSDDNISENKNNNSASPNKFLNNISSNPKSNQGNNVYDNILMQNILNPKKINLNNNNNVERGKSSTTDSPPISIRRQVEEMNNNNNNNYSYSNNNNFNVNRNNSSSTSPVNINRNNLNSEAVNKINCSPISSNNNNSSSHRRISSSAQAEKPENIVASGNNFNNSNVNNQTANFFGNFASNNNISANKIGKYLNAAAAAKKEEEVKNDLFENNIYKSSLTERNNPNHNNNSNNNAIHQSVNTNVNPLFTFSNNMQTPKSIKENYKNSYINNISNINNNNNNKNNNTNSNQLFLSQKAKNEFINFLSENPVHKPNSYKYMDLILKKPISSFKLENNIKFFYQVNKGEISDTTLWSPFDEEDCILLELYYPNYLIGGPSEVYLERLRKVVNFKYMMLVDAENPENHIHVKRSLPYNLSNVIRRSRFSFEDSLSSENLKNKVLPSLNILKDYAKYQEYFVCFEFSFIKNHNFEVKIPKKFEYLWLECVKISNYGAFLVSLREEVESLRLKFAKRNSIYLNYLDSLENSPKFFQIIIQMFTEDGFLSKELNKVLRKPTLERLDKIKHFYLAVLVSLTYCALNVRPKLALEPAAQANNSNAKNKSNGFSAFSGNNLDGKGKWNDDNNNNNENEKVVKTQESNVSRNKKANDENDRDVLVESSVLNANVNVNFNKGKSDNVYGVEKNYFVYSPYKLSSDELAFYKENKYNILFFDEFISATPNKTNAENYLKAYKSMELSENDENNFDNADESNNNNNNNQSSKSKGKGKSYNTRKENPNNFSNGNNNIENEYEHEEENNNTNINQNNSTFEEKTNKVKTNNLKSHNLNKTLNKKTSNNSNQKNNISVIFEIEVPYYMLESENMHVDSLAFAYESNFSLYPQDEEVVLKSGSILMLKDIVQNSKEVYQFTLKFVVLSFSWKGFFDCLAYNQTTKEINLNKNGIGNFRKSVKYLCEALVKNKNIEKLCLRENHFGENYESMKYLANLISISNFSYGSESENNNLELIESLKNLPENLYNNNNHNNLNNQENLKLLNYFNLTSEIYLSSIPKLKVLDLSSNFIGKDAKITKQFCEALSINQNLTHLNLSNNLLSEIESAKALSSALIANKSLKSLNLSANNLGTNLLSMNYISEAIQFNGILSEISLADNNLGERTDIVKSLADALARNKALKSLDLSANAFGINSISVRYLAEGLILNMSILELDLKNNLLGNLESLSYLCALLEKNANLQVLDLAKNKFGVNKESYTLLGEAISVNKNLHTLNLSNNNLNTHLDYLKCLLDSLKCNVKLRKIHLSYNSLSNNEDFKMFVKSMLKERNINYLGTSEI